MIPNKYYTKKDLQQRYKFSESSFKRSFQRLIRDKKIIKFASMFNNNFILYYMLNNKEHIELQRKVKHERKSLL